MRELDALRAECAAAEATLGEIRPEDWSLHGLGEWSLAELVAHLVGGVERIVTYLDEPVPEADGLVDPVEYFRYDPDEVAPGVAQRARERAASIDPMALAVRFAEAWREAARRAESEGPARVLPTFRGPMRLGDYLATRVLEVVVHHMDVCAALGVPPVATPDAARLTMEVLEGLLGSRRPRNFGRARFIKAATGRIEVDDPRFPVLR
jgi:uncharacterized protein (TIGR03083 family)